MGVGCNSHKRQLADNRCANNGADGKKKRKTPNYVSVIAYEEQLSGRSSQTKSSFLVKAKVILKNQRTQRVASVIRRLWKANIETCPANLWQWRVRMVSMWSVRQVERLNRGEWMDEWTSGMNERNERAEWMNVKEVGKEESLLSSTFQTNPVTGWNAFSFDECNQNHLICWQAHQNWPWIDRFSITWSVVTPLPSSDLLRAVKWTTRQEKFNLPPLFHWLYNAHLNLLWSQFLEKQSANVGEKNK